MSWIPKLKREPIFPECQFPWRKNAAFSTDRPQDALQFDTEAECLKWCRKNTLDEYEPIEFNEPFEVMILRVYSEWEDSDHGKQMLSKPLSHMEAFAAGYRIATQRTIK